MSGVNRVTLLGRLGQDPEVKEVSGGLKIANFSLATSKSWKDEGGEKQEKTEWHNIVAFKQKADLVGKYLSKGRQVYIEGELQTRSWDDKETGAKRYKTEIIANHIEFIGDNKSAADENHTDEKSPAFQQPSNNEEIPF